METENDELKFYHFLKFSEFLQLFIQTKKKKRNGEEQIDDYAPGVERSVIILSTSQHILQLNELLSIKPQSSLDYMSKLLNRFKVFKRNINISLSFFYKVARKINK